MNAGFLPLILQADQKYRISAITARLMLQIMSERLTGH
ncbi:putative DNA-binding transcriptional regulator, DEOR-type [Escherichia coli 2-177-06_S3_C2]|nr:putative DNA-binding transcriptional regulator, DEOR-type [Escherichia coli 2-210-07_S3_C2]KDX43825.1 putative DNA-binding transcriptional regulator, DEOR-type [Escherichia coli 2-177-06_S3_C2]KEM51860.1 putative DNA-binding transcriptional regulator, DEOR-type [Escherichia coli 6-319-05_S4_C3]KEO08857.1 putative DNA-binding transcriptional regulator, DEOR-type [Escherichia coli 2-177-06_S3_C3]